MSRLLFWLLVLIFVSPFGVSAYSYFEQHYNTKNARFIWYENNNTGQIEYVKLSYYNDRLDKWVKTELKRSK